MRNSILLALWALIFQTGFSQIISTYHGNDYIKGTVVDTYSRGIEGVYLKVKDVDGKKIISSTVTSKWGDFIIKVPEGVDYIDISHSSFPDLKKKVPEDRSEHLMIVLNQSVMMVLPNGEHKQWSLPEHTFEDGEWRTIFIDPKK